MVTSDAPSLRSSFAARRFDGISALPQDGRVTINRGDIVFQAANGLAPQHLRLGDAFVSEPLLHAPRQFRWPDGSALHVDESEQLAGMIADAGLRTSFVVRWQRAWPASLIALVLLVAGAAWLYLEGLPRGAEWLAEHIPPTLEEHMGEQALAALDKGVLAPSTLSLAQQAALTARFAAFEQAAGLTSVRRVVFRSMKGYGINAFALPGGTVVFLDGLVHITVADEELLLAVLAHEAGHQQQHHMTRALFRGLGAAALAGLLWGDYSSVASNAAILFGQLSYSRKDEAAADDFAIVALRRAGISPAAVARLIRLLSAEIKAGSVTPGWMSTHPGNEARAKHAMEAAEADRQGAASAPAR
jgi:Zn-dependent protease with chaperone function